MADTGTAARAEASRRSVVPAVMRLLTVAVVLCVSGVTAWLLVTTVAPTSGGSVPAPEIPALEVAAAPVQPGTVLPVGNASVPQPQGGTGVDPLRTWADQLTGATGIPARALMAYGNAELVLRSSAPNCHLSWATLAGIGRIESNHGQYGGAVLGADGRPSTPIYGVPLDGSTGVRSIPDTDGGSIDGDPGIDRAVGPMQFIPSTWRKWASDANLDGRGDPQQIDDAALAAGRYLCANGRNLATADGWWSGVFSYNNSVPYGQKVFGLADTYARAATGQHG